MQCVHAMHVCNANKRASIRMWARPVDLLPFNNLNFCCADMCAATETVHVLAEWLSRAVLSSASAWRYCMHRVASVLFPQEIKSQHIFGAGFCLLHTECGIHQMGNSGSAAHHEYTLRQLPNRHHGVLPVSGLLV